jgi:cytidylate kinase
MKPQEKSLPALVEERCKKWEIEEKKRGRDSRRPVITVSRQAGSMGRSVAKKISDETGMPLYGAAIMKQVAENAGAREMVIRSLDEQSRSWLEGIVAAWGRKENIVTDAYDGSLVRVIGAIGRHGNAIIMGRGGAFILPPSNNFRVRFVAPLQQRIGSFVREFKLSHEEAGKRIDTVDADRREFVKTRFGADIDDPIHYDLIINGDSISPGEAVGIIRAALALNRKG